MGKAWRWASVELHFIGSEQFECQGMKFWIKISVLWKKFSNSERMVYVEDRENLLSYFPGYSLSNILRS